MIEDKRAMPTPDGWALIQDRIIHGLLMQEQVSEMPELFNALNEAYFEIDGELSDESRNEFQKLYKEAIEDGFVDDLQYQSIWSDVLKIIEE